MKHITATLALLALFMVFGGATAMAQDDAANGSPCCNANKLPGGPWKDSCWNDKWSPPRPRYDTNPPRYCTGKFIARCKSQTAYNGRMSYLNGLTCEYVQSCGYRLKNVDGKLVCAD